MLLFSGCLEGGGGAHFPPFLVVYTVEYTKLQGRQGFDAKLRESIHCAGSWGETPELVFGSEGGVPTAAHGFFRSAAARAAASAAIASASAALAAAAIESNAAARSAASRLAFFFRIASWAASGNPIFAGVAFGDAFCFSSMTVSTAALKLGAAPPLDAEEAPTILASAARAFAAAASESLLLGPAVTAGGLAPAAAGAGSASAWAGSSGSGVIAESSVVRCPMGGTATALPTSAAFAPGPGDVPAKRCATAEMPLLCAPMPVFPALALDVPSADFAFSVGCASADDPADIDRRWPALPPVGGPEAPLARIATGDREAGFEFRPAFGLPTDFRPVFGLPAPPPFRVNASVLPP